MFENEIKLIALFFFFATLDDKKALATSSKAADLFYLRMKKNPQLSPNITLVAVTKQIWDKSKNNYQRGRPHFSNESGWMFPTDLDFSPWKEFQKVSYEDELLAVIWSRILKISDVEISKALGISEGTLRYRVGRALRKLGGMTQNAKQNLTVVSSNV